MPWKYLRMWRRCACDTFPADIQGKTPNDERWGFDFYSFSSFCKGSTSLIIEPLVK